METDEERKAKLEKIVAAERLRLAMEKMVCYRAAQVGHGDGRRKKSKDVATTRP